MTPSKTASACGLVLKLGRDPVVLAKDGEDAVDQGIVEQGFFENELDAGGAGPRAKPRRRMIGEKDRGQPYVARTKTPQQFEAVHMRHAIVQDDAAGARQIDVGQQFDAVPVSMHIDAFEPERELKRIAHPLVVIGDQDEMLAVRHR